MTILTFNYITGDLDYAYPGDDTHKGFYCSAVVYVLDNNSNARMVNIAGMGEFETSS